MAYLVAAWAVILGMFLWAAYLYFHWAGAAELPMQWGITGKPTWYAARLPAVALIPVISAVALAFVSFTRARHSYDPGLLLIAGFFLAAQGLWVVLARRYV